MLVKLGNWLFHYCNIIFPVFYAALFIPSPVIFQSEEWALTIGMLLIALGFIIRCITVGLVYVNQCKSKCQIHAETLVTKGMYKVCRNPMYLGNILLLLGFGLFANSLLFILIFIPLFVFFSVAIICAEEDFLSKKFGQQFIDYKTNSNFILPQWGNLKSAFEGQTFKWEEVINKEHDSLFLYFSGMCILLLYDSQIDIKSFLNTEVTLLLFYGFIKHLKRKNLL